jgi:flagellum-specific ATP synthase
VNVLDSLSRLMPAVASREHRAQATLMRRLLAAHARSEDLVRIGAYKPGADAELDQAMQAMPTMRRFLEQDSLERMSLEETVEQLMAMAL